MQRAKRANELVAWVNNLLRTSEVRTLDDLKSGVHLVQIVHSIDPDAFDLARVDFRASNDYYYARNLKLLQQQLADVKLSVEFNLEAVAQGEKRNDLFGLVSYLKHHYAAVKGRVNSRSALTYDPVLHRRRAVERRQAGKRLPRVAGLVDGRGGDGGSQHRLQGLFSASRGGSSGYVGSAAGDAVTVVSDNSQTAMSSYTTLSTKQRHTRMKLRSAELERWRGGVQLPLRRASSYDVLGGLGSAIMSRGSYGAVISGVPVGDRSSTQTPHRASQLTPVSATNAGGLPGSGFAIDLEPIDLGGGDLACVHLWPDADHLDADQLDPACLAANASPTAQRTPKGAKSPTRASTSSRPAWAALDATLAALGATPLGMTQPAPLFA